MLKHSLATICYEQIQDQYYYGLFGDFKLIIDTETNQFNATKLCNDGGKYLYHWFRRRESKELIEIICGISDGDKSVNRLFKTVKGGDNETDVGIIAGTYLPKQLILSIGMWISNEFYVKVYNIVLDYFVQEYRKKCKNNIERLKLKVGESERRHDRLELEKDCLVVETNALDSQYHEILTDNEQFEDDVVPKTSRTGELNMLVVVRKNAEGDAYPYYVLRCQRRARGRAIRNLKRRYPECEVAHEIPYNPNSVTLFNRVKENLRYMDYRANHMRVADFERFKRDLEELIPKLIT